MYPCHVHHHVCDTLHSCSHSLNHVTNYLLDMDMSYHSNHEVVILEYFFLFDAEISREKEEKKKQKKKVNKLHV